ncbi:Transaldolase [Aphelenchoides besseyi]|nr:Transaldolase [Aphelenchoides besseyi]
MTLVFNYEQAIACAQANVTLISPFVGPIFDWHVQTTRKKKFARDDDPGVKKMAKDKKLEPVLTVEKAKQSDLEEVNVTENLFYFQLSEDEMATAKLDEGIMKFAADVVESKKMIDKYI